MLSYLVILNPKSGKGFAGRSIPLIRSTLEKHGINHTLVCTGGVQHADKLAEQAARDGYDAVIVAAGDGTANEAINGLMSARKAGHDKTAFGMISVGNGNDLAYGLGIPHGIEAGCHVIAENWRKKIDVGFLRGGDYPEGRYFGNGVGIGFDAATGFAAQRLTWIRGLACYLIAAIQTVFIYYKAPKVKLTIDGQEEILSALMISIMNGKRMGGGFYFAPNGNPGDGWFDLCIARSISKLRVFGLIPYVMKGTQHTQKEIRIAKGQRISVQAIEGTLPIHADGETICLAGSSIIIELIPKQIEVITAKMPDQPGSKQ